MFFKRVVWDYKQGDYERFRQQVSDTDWDTIINDDDTTNNVCINFTDKFLTIAKECIPLKTILVRHNDKPWISSELKKEIIKRDRLRQKFLRLKTLSTEQKYKSQRNKVNNIKKKQCKVSYFEKNKRIAQDNKHKNVLPNRQATA